MALFNNNTAPSPFGSTSALPTPNIGAQFFMGATVIDFNVSADWSSQGGTLSVNLLEDTLNGSRLNYNAASGTWTAGGIDGFGNPLGLYEQKITDLNILDYANLPATYGSLPIIGSPQHFRVLDPSNNIIFQYDGILQSISRNASPNAGKVYSVSLQSPLKLLENCSMMLKSYPGFGHAKEGFPSGISQNAYYKLSSVPANYSPDYFNHNLRPEPGLHINTDLDIDLDQDFNAMADMQLNEIYENGRPSDKMVDSTPEGVGVTFGSNNRNMIWANVYNVQNVFGIFENEQVLSIAGTVGYSKFGASRSSQGMRLDMIAYALDELINRNPHGTPLPPKRYFGGNILSGTTTYNFADVAAKNILPFPYFFGFDVYTFMNQMMDKLGADYVYPGDVSSNLLDLVSSLCEYAGLDFVVELNRIQTSDASAPNYWDGTDTVSNYDCPGSLYDGGSFHLEESFSATVPGGVISIKTLDRRSLQLSDPKNVTHPFSKIAYQILGYEVPDYGDKNLAGAHINPGDPDPMSSAFENGAFGTYLDPLDDDYTNKGTDGSSIDPTLRNANTSGYGGKFPVETKLDQHQGADVAGLDILNLTDAATQTQITLRDNQQTTAKFVTGGLQSRIHKVPQKFIYQYWGEVQINSNTSACQAPLDTQIRSIPVITPILEHDDITDFIMVDVQDVFPSGSSQHLQNIAPQSIYPTSVAEIRAAMSNKNNWYNYLLLVKPCVLYNLFKGLSPKKTAERLANFLFIPQGTGTAVNVNSLTPNPPVLNNVNSPSPKPNTSQQAPSKTKVPTGVSSEAPIFKIIDKLFNKVKTIGDTHYGKSWVAWSPQVTTKINDDITNYGEYQKSWSPSDSAYLEPSVYDTFHAPQHNKFLDGGKLKAFANFESVYEDGDEITYRTASVSTTPNQSINLSAGTFSLDFSKVSEDSKFQSNYCDGSKVNLKINVDKEYIFVPYDYFHWYDRGRRPLIDENGNIFDIEYADGPGEIEYPFLVANTGYAIYDGTAKSGQDADIGSMRAVTDFYNSVDYSKVAAGSSQYKLNQVLCNDSSNTGESPSQGISNTRLVDDFINLKCPDHGVNCITFTKFTTDRINFPKELVLDEKSLEVTAIRVAKMAIKEAEKSDPLKKSPTPPSGVESRIRDSASLIYADACVAPFEAGIPQQSIRHRYGPWFTSSNFTYGGRVEIIQDDKLLPENFIFPLYGTLTSNDSNGPSFAEQLSGFVGMNFAGQAIANSIDGYGQFAAEDGSITMPGGPLIRRIGDALLNGPYITELNIKVGTRGIETTYSFNSAVKKQGRTNADIVKKLSNISSFITGK